VEKWVELLLKLFVWRRRREIGGLWVFVVVNDVEGVGGRKKEGSY
jgi:hypothetical protein